MKLYEIVFSWSAGLPALSEQREFPSTQSAHEYASRLAEHMPGRPTVGLWEGSTLLATFKAWIMVECTVGNRGSVEPSRFSPKEI